MEEFIFYCIGIGVCVFGFLTVFSRNVFHSAVWLALTLLSVASVYFYLGAEFLGVIQVLVYVGGIITLFIFAIKLTAQIDDKSIRQTNRQVLVSGVAAFIIFCILATIASSYWRVPSETGSSLAPLEKIGESLLTRYALPFEFISLVLLAAMVGAIVIGKVKR